VSVILSHQRPQKQDRYDEQCFVRPYVKWMWILEVVLYVTQFGRNIDTIVQTTGYRVILMGGYL